MVRVRVKSEWAGKALGIAMAQTQKQYTLGKPYRNVVPLRAVELASGCTLFLAKGSVVTFSGDAIVNAANEGCLGGSGVDGAISDAGGDALYEARRKLPVLEGRRRCATGDAKITIGGDLNARFCIHAVGPMYFRFKQDEADALLESAYVASLERAKEKQLSTVAFSLLSAGIFKGMRSLDAVLEIGMRAIKDNTYEGLKEVFMIGFLPTEVEGLLDAAKRIFDVNEGTEKSGVENASKIEVEKDKSNNNEDPNHNKETVDKKDNNPENVETKERKNSFQDNNDGSVSEVVDGPKET